jgi:hypothetical protein
MSETVIPTTPAVLKKKALCALAIALGRSQGRNQLLQTLIIPPRNANQRLAVASDRLRCHPPSISKPSNRTRAKHADATSAGPYR